jgi:drug/metabolite transporter (DMT)-like permease
MHHGDDDDNNEWQDEEILYPLSDAGKSSSKWRNRFDAMKLVLSKYDLYFIIPAMIAFNVCSAVLRKVLYDSYGQLYVFFRQQLTNFMYDVWSTVVVFGKLAFTTHITSDQGYFPIWKFAVMSLCDSLADFLGSVGGVGTPGSFAVLLNQTVVFFTMVAAYVVLRQKYKPIQVFGAVLIIGGTALAIVPTFTGGGDSGSSGAVWYSVVLYTMSNAPSAAAYVFKEWAFKAADLDVFYLTAMVSWIQLLLSWLWVPLLALPGFGGQPLDTVLPSFVNGFKCFIGDETMPVVNAAGVFVGYCSWRNTVYTFGYSFSGFAAGILQLYVIKKGSAVLSIIAQAISLPLANIVFSIGPIMGKEVEPFTPYSIGGLVVVTIGFLIYSFFGREFRAAWRRKSRFNKVREIGLAGDDSDDSDGDAIATPSSLIDVDIVDGSLAKTDELSDSVDSDDDDPYSLDFSLNRSALDDGHRSRCGNVLARTIAWCCGAEFIPARL